jgi:hypothetical protein
MHKYLWALALWIGVAATCGALETRPVQNDLSDEWRIQFHVIGEQIVSPRFPYAERAHHPQLLIRESDRHPVDVLVRRTRALLADLEDEMDPDAAEEARRILARAEQQADDLPPLRGGIPALKGGVVGKKQRDEAPPPTKAGTMDDAVYEPYRAVFETVCRLNRQISLSNPLLDFDRIAFVKRHPPRVGHMCDQWFGMAQDPGGGLYALEDPFGDNPRLTNLTAGQPVEKGRLAGSELHRGVFACPEVSYDGRTVWFAYSESTRAFSERWEQAFKEGRASPWGNDLFKEEFFRTREDAFHLMKINADGTGLAQLTDGAEDDHSPCLLPNGRIAFVSTRRGGEGRCHPRPCPSYVLHTMLPDGSDIQPLSYHELNEWTPRVNNAGDIIYSRWDYVDRKFSDGQHPWIMKPDGRMVRALYGNWENEFSRGKVQEDLRQVPDSPLYVGVIHSHHCSAYGGLVIYDSTEPDTAEQPGISVLTPEIHANGPSRYASPYPLSEKYFLCVWSPDSHALTLNTWKWFRPSTPHGVYLIDTFGNKTLLYRDPEIAAMGPLPLAARPKPPVQPHGTATAAPPGQEPLDTDPEFATFALMDVYDSVEPWPEDRKLASLRIVQVFPKSTPRKGIPPIAYNLEANARGVIGTVPIEEDGSAHFTIPAGVPVYFQALDEDGLAVQSMRSSAYGMPGETESCQGCHEPRRQAPVTPARTPLAMQREPSVPEPGPEGAWPMSFPRMIQPVLDEKCVGCHKKKDKAPPLTGDRGGLWNCRSKAYKTLGRFAWCYAANSSGYAGRGKGWGNVTNPVRSIPGKVGSTEAPLYHMLTTGSHKDRVELTEEQMEAITTWLDCMSPFFGSYNGQEEQRDGMLVIPDLQ